MLNLKNFKPYANILTKTLKNNYSITSVAMGDKIDGASLVCKSLKEQGVEYMFGVVGIPIVEIGFRAQQYGIKYVGMRNEQSASYAASAIGYLTRKPAACLVVPGPGFIHSLAGMANANENAWPLIVIGGSSEVSQESCMSFQEFPQVAVSKHFTKYGARPSSLSTIPSYVEKAVRNSTFGRPGAVYLDIPAEMVTDEIDVDSVRQARLCEEAPRPFASPEKIEEVYEALKYSKRPLFVLGKGSSYSQAEKEIIRLIENLKLPFLPTPMGKGIVDDDHKYCIAAARSTALKDADLVILLGARLNWMLHFGQPPRFSQNVKIVQVDINAEDLGNNTKDCIQIQADIQSFCKQMNENLAKKHYDVDQSIKANWWSTLKEKCAKNKTTIKNFSEDQKVPLNYYAAYAEIKRNVPENCMIVSEGANTMDTSRSIMNHKEPRQRLDAGSFGTMGVGSGFAIAAALQCRDHSPEKRVLCIQGDSAFGFGGMEIETAFRYNLPIIFIIFNNNGIYGGLDKQTFDEVRSSGDPCLNLGPMSLTANIRYDKLASAFEGFEGYYAETTEQIKSALDASLKNIDKPTIINISINPTADRKAQEFPWLTKSKV